MWAAMTSQNQSWSVMERLAFPAPQASYDLSSFPGELILLPSAPTKGGGAENDNYRVPCIFLPSAYARFVFICFHGNAEDLGTTHQFLCAIRDIFKVHVLAIEYPGYGICSGVCSEQGIMANAQAAMHFTTETLNWPYDGIKILGRSLGTGPAIALVAQHPVAGLILVTPFLSVREVLRHSVGSLADLTDDCFRNYKLVEQIASPTLIIHGTSDSLVPISHGLWLYEQLGGQKMMVCPKNWHHNSSLLDNLCMFVTPMTQFFSLPDFTFTNIELPRWVMPDYVAGGGESTADGPSIKPPKPIQLQQVCDRDPAPVPS
jgi:pimeloyl-ACP methyl ester carboxylesterase